MRLLLPISAFLLWHEDAMAFDASDFLVKGLEEIEPAYATFDGEMYAGTLPIDVLSNEKTGELMFWLFKPHKPAAPDSLTLWLNGGPGCSSFFAGVMFECAPVTSPHYPAGYPETSYDEPLVPNPWAWTNATNMLFVEQPAGVGFSWGPMPHIEEDLAIDFYNFLVNFYDTFPDMYSKRLFIFGESYAGMYVPSIAHHIHVENKKKDRRKMNLKGIGLGNGWIDAYNQGPMVIDYAYWHGMIDSTIKDTLHALWEDCENGAAMDPPFHDFTIPDECNFMTATLTAAGAGIFPDKSPNTYDVTTWDKYPVLFHPNSTYVRFYNNPKVKKALHAPMDTTWVGCIPGAGRRLEEELPGKILLAHDKPESVVPYLAELLDDADVRVLIYNGDRDLSTCAQGSEKCLNEMKWSGAGEWRTSKRGLWMVDGQVAGYAKSHKGLDFVVLYNSGHLAPNNVPGPALDLITRFGTDEAYLDIELPTFDIPKKKFTKNIAQHQPMFQAILIFVVALVCFGCGALAATHRNKKKHQYSRIADVTNGDINLASSLR